MVTILSQRQCDNCLSGSACKLNLKDNDCHKPKLKYSKTLTIVMFYVSIVSCYFYTSIFHTMIIDGAGYCYIR